MPGIKESKNPDSSPSFSIRQARPNDLETLVSWVTSFFNESPEFRGLKPDVNKTLVYLFNIMMNDHDLLLVGEEKGSNRPVAALIAEINSLWYTSDVVADEKVFYILPEFRGKSLAREMLLCYVRWAESKQVVKTRIGVSTGLELEKTKGFFEGSGFALTGFNFSRG